MHCSSMGARHAPPHEGSLSIVLVWHLCEMFTAWYHISQNSICIHGKLNRYCAVKGRRLRDFPLTYQRLRPSRLQMPKMRSH